MFFSAVSLQTAKAWTEHSLTRNSKKFAVDLQLGRRFRGNHVENLLEVAREPRTLNVDCVPAAHGTPSGAGAGLGTERSTSKQKAAKIILVDMKSYRSSVSEGIREESHGTRNL